ncbi:MAG: hypothetical protein OHK0022_14490 [Roseiflexaceae bacterium]
MNEPSSPSLSAPLPTTLLTDARRRLLNGAALLLALLWLVALALTITPESDYQYYWSSARRFLEDGQLYELHPDVPVSALPEGDPIRGKYIYPPVFTYLIQPLGLLDYPTSLWVWLALNAGFLAGFVWLCVQISGATLAWRLWGPLILLVLIAPPVRLSFQLGQLSLLLALMLAGTLALERRPLIAATLLALISWFRIYPALMGLYYLLDRRYALVRWCILAGLAIFGVSLLIYGLEPYQSFLQNILLQYPYPYAAEHNISLFGFWSRLLTDNPYTRAPLQLPELAVLLNGLSSLALLGWCALLTRRAGPQADRRLLFCLWSCVMLLLSPTNGYYNLVLALLPLLLLLRTLEQRPDPAMRNWLVLGSALLCIPPTWTDGLPLLYNSLHTGWGVLALTPSLYGLLIYTWLLGRLMGRNNASL